MRIYVDFDDCLCETARSFSELAAKMFGKDVPKRKEDPLNWINLSV